MGVMGETVEDEGEEEERRSNSFGPRVPEGGDERARAVR